MLLISVTDNDLIFCIVYFLILIYKGVLRFRIMQSEKADRKKINVLFKKVLNKVATFMDEISSTQCSKFDLFAD